MEDDDVIHYADARFEIRPYPTYADLMRINGLVNELGYTFLFSMKQYSLEDVQHMLRTEGPQAFLRRVRLQEDISPRATFEGAVGFVAARLGSLAPASELMITDPYLFPPRPKLGADKYSEHLTTLIAPILAQGADLKLVVNPQANREIETKVCAGLRDFVPGVTIHVYRSDDFHDRFWVADRSRGVVVGASLNGLGGKLFLMDNLKPSDVAAVVETVDGVPTSDWDTISA